MARWVGVDYGLKRIGLAISDAGESFAAAIQTLQAAGTASLNARLVYDWGRQNEAGGYVVGLPLNMDGTDSDQTRYSRIFASELAKLADTVELWDERLSTFKAENILREADVSRSKRAGLRDALAAQAILQSFLDARRDPRQ